MLSCSHLVIGKSDGCDVTAILRGRRLAAKQQIVDLPVDEVAVALEVVLVDVQAGGGAKEALELVDRHRRHHASLFRMGSRRPVGRATGGASAAAPGFSEAPMSRPVGLVCGLRGSMVELQVTHPDDGLRNGEARRARSPNDLLARNARKGRSSRRGPDVSDNRCCSTPTLRRRAVRLERARRSNALGGRMVYVLSREKARPAPGVSWGGPGSDISGQMFAI
jgi:hypothetical protein